MLRLRFGCLALAVAVSVPVGSSGQAGGEPPEFVPRTVLAGSDIPEAYIYRHFFGLARDMLIDSVPIRDHFLTQLGLEPESAAAEAFAEAVDEAWSIITGGVRPNVTIQQVDANTTVVTTEVPQPTPVNDATGKPDSSREAIRRQEREQARRLGVVIARLSARLTTLGHDFDSIERHVREHLTPSARQASTDVVHPDHHIWQVQRAFEQGRQSAVEAEGP